MSRAKSSEYFGQRLQPGQAEALQALYKAIAAVLDANPAAIPCTGPRARLWTDPAPTSVRHAKQGCQDCALLRMCGSYARTYKETSGVWGGRAHG